jgi:hypothetical protein
MKCVEWKDRRGKIFTPESRWSLLCTGFFKSKEGRKEAAFFVVVVVRKRRGKKQ